MIIIEMEIFMKKEIEKFNTCDIMEGMPSISAVIKAMQKGITDRKIITVFVDKEKKKSKEKEITFLLYRAEELGFALEFVDSEMISEHTVGNSHGGIIAFCSAKTLPDLSPDKINKNGVYFLLDGVEDPYNFGYSVRSIYASGADGIILPHRNWMGVSGVVARSSAGSSELIDIFVAEPSDAVDIFKTIGFTVVSAGIRDSESLYDVDLNMPLLVILGGEKRGISREILNKSDKILRIDYGVDFNGSLPTASSVAIFAFEILRKNRSK